MLERKLPGAARGCAGCFVVLATGEPCFLDEATGRDYCSRCGERLRYHRKKALERGETMPETLATAGVRPLP